jgi:hypothetical protein
MTNETKREGEKQDEIYANDKWDNLPIPLLSENRCQKCDCPLVCPQCGFLNSRKSYCKSEIRQAIKEAFERVRPKERETILIKPEWICKEMFSIEFEKSPMKKIIDNSYISGYNQCLQELKSNEEEYLK